MAKLDPNKISRWHKLGLWTAKMVDDAVTEGCITKAQADKIKKEATAK